MLTPSSNRQLADPVDGSQRRGEIADAVIAAIRAALPTVPPGKQVALHEPSFGGREWDYVKECIDTSWVSSVGAFVDRFERMLADKVEAGAAIATVNGTAAIHAALLVAGVRPHDEVIIPTLTFIATANAVSYCGAIPHFVDASRLTLGMDPARLADHLAAVGERRGGEFVNRATGRVIRAVMPMHTYGHPVDLDPIAELCRDRGIMLIEDAAEALGSLYKGRPVGRSGDLAVFSFNGNKTITTGGGGAIVTNNAVLAERAKHLTTTARLKNGWRFDHDCVGYNYRLPNINAALGCAQLEQLDGFIARKRELARRYAAAFASVDQVRSFVEPPFATSNYWLNVILLDEAAAGARDTVLDRTNAAGLQTRPSWTLMHRLPMYLDCPRDDLSVAEAIDACLINIPSSPSL
jgi:perosamine synthetase